MTRFLHALYLLMPPGSLFQVDSWPAAFILLFCAAVSSLAVWRNKRVAYWSIVAFLIVSTFATVVDVSTRFDLLGEAGFGDAFILHSVQNYQKTGRIYISPSESGELPGVSIYSPLTYMLLAMPGLIGAPENAFIGPRWIEVIFLVLCAIVIVSITRILLPNSRAWVWSILGILSINILRLWILQIRGDFPAILLGLIAIRLLMNPSPWAVPLAGLCAGLAVEFKITYVAAGIAGFVWLTYQRKWKHVALFSIAALTASITPFLLVFPYEPNMLAQMTILRQSMKDYFGLLVILVTVIKEPVTCVAIASLPFALTRAEQRWRLLLLYAGISALIATAADTQIGGAGNYYFEALMALSPFAALGITFAKDSRFNLLVTAILSILVLDAFVMAGAQAYWKTRFQRDKVIAQNHGRRQLRKALAEVNVLSFVPSASFLASRTVVNEPYLLSHLDLLGQLDLSPFRERIKKQEFELVITHTPGEVYRKLPHISPGVHKSIEEAYRPYCVFEDWLIHIPSNASITTQQERLRDAGCNPEAEGVRDGKW